jgi:hypothetical protein
MLTGLRAEMCLYMMPAVSITGSSNEIIFSFHSPTEIRSLLNQEAVRTRFPVFAQKRGQMVGQLF